LQNFDPFTVTDASRSGDGHCTSTDEAPMKVVAKKKRKTGGPLYYFVDHPMTQQEQAEANVMFFRLVITVIIVRE